MDKIWLFAIFTACSNRTDIGAMQPNHDAAPVDAVVVMTPADAVPEPIDATTSIPTQIVSVHIENGSHEPLLHETDPSRAPMTWHFGSDGQWDYFSWNFVDTAYPCGSVDPCVESVRYSVDVRPECQVIDASAWARDVNTDARWRLLHGDTVIFDIGAAEGESPVFDRFYPETSIYFEYVPVTCTDIEMPCAINIGWQFLRVECPVPSQ